MSANIEMLEAEQKRVEAVGDEFCFSRDDFLAIVRQRDELYRYSVRDLRGERPTIHGSGSDFVEALSAVTRLLDALVDSPHHQTC